MISLPREQLDSFLSFVQFLRPSLDFSCTVSKSFVTFLDILVTIHHSDQTSIIYYKNTDSHLTSIIRHPTPNTLNTPSIIDSSVHPDSGVTTGSLLLGLSLHPTRVTFHSYPLCLYSGTICSLCLYSFSSYLPHHNPSPP